MRAVAVVHGIIVSLGFGLVTAQLSDKTASPSMEQENESLEIGPAANTVRMPATLQANSKLTDLPGDDATADALESLALPVDTQLKLQNLQNQQRSLIRRESHHISTSDVHRHKRFDLNEEDAEEEHHHHSPPAFQGDPHLTPEAIFANKNIAPEIAEFLGHMAQRSRVHHKEAIKVSREAGLMQGRERSIDSEDNEDDDDSDDIEDMKKAAASGPKKTALSQFFDVVDSRHKAGSWIHSECAAIAENITHQYLRMKGRSRATWATAGPAGAMGRAEVHLGMFFRHWKVGDLQQIARKFRLSVLSFLATQDAGRVKLHIWTDLDNHNSSLREILGPIAYHPELMDAINITQFDPKIEFAKVPPTFARETLNQRYKSNEMPALKPDLIRSVILYNYGGLWMDADTVLLQDVAPLLGEDWAYLVAGRQGAIEGALLSASKPASHFTNEYLISYVMRQPPIHAEQTKEQPLLVELFNRDPSHTTLHALPPCFFDSDTHTDSVEAVLVADASTRSNFFEKVVAEPYREIFSVGIRDALQDGSGAEASVLQGPAFARYANPEQDQDDDEKQSASTSPSFAYHWRGNYASPWVTGSLADVAERTFMKKLNIHVK